MTTRLSHTTSLFLTIMAAITLLVAACNEMYPEVVVVNQTGEHILLKDISFNGCVWEGVLAYKEATAPGRCLPGEDRIHFRKLDAHSYCTEQAEDGAIDGLCRCRQITDTADEDSSAEDTSAEAPSVDEGLVNETPNWFNYQTLTVHNVDYGEFRRIEISLNDLEQDFSVPGPYGH